MKFIAAWWFSSPPISSSNLPLTVEEQSSTPHAPFRLDIIQLDRSMLIGANPMTASACLGSRDDTYDEGIVCCPYLRPNPRSPVQCHTLWRRRFGRVQVAVVRRSGD